MAGSQDGEQPDGPVADHRDRLARAGHGGYGPKPAGTEHVRGGQQGGDQLESGHLGGGHQGAVGHRDPGQLGLGALRRP